MSFASRRIAAVAAAALTVAGAGAALVADSGRAQDTGRTYTITYGKSDGAANDIAPKGLGHGRGRASVGDQLFVTNAIKRNDGVRGRLQVTYVVGQKKVPLVNSRGQLSGVYRFPDGAIFIEAEGTFKDSSRGSSAPSATAGCDWGD